MKVATLGSCHSLNKGFSGWVSFMNLDYAQSLMKDLPILISSPNGVPVYAHAGDAGCDLRSSHAAVIEPGERLTVSTGISIAIPAGYVGLVHSRSGLAANHGVVVLNSPGTVDAGYRGEIRVTLLNTDKNKAFEVQPGDRIAQLLFQKIDIARFIEVETLPATERGENGFGSTGTK
jgi:dUTP pyrophosphatase